jgi:hypothetical protein
MITRNDRFRLDRAKQIFYTQVELERGITRKMLNTMWVWGTRALYFARTQGNIDPETNTAIAAVAKQSKKARRLKTKDGGLQGFVLGLKSKGFDLCYDPKSMRVAERNLEAMGVLQMEREGFGRVAIAHINLRALALFLELYHPPYEELEGMFGDYFNWVKPACDEILGRGFNRKNEDGELYDGNYLEEDLAIFEDAYPCLKFAWEKLTAIARGAFGRFCQKSRRIIESVCVHWDVDISNPPDWSEFA